MTAGPGSTQVGISTPGSSCIPGSLPEHDGISYYRYWMRRTHHNVYAHYGVRTVRYKLIYYYADALDQLGAIDGT